MRILVTGAAGFIGSHVALELLEAGYDVICIDNFSNSVQDNDGNSVSLKRVSQIINKEVPFVFADCSNEKQLEAVFKKYSINGVVHLAGWKAVGESVKNPLDYYSNNLTATLVLLKLCGKYNVKSFIFSSSATVYGPPKSLPIKETDPVGCTITNPYGYTKYMSERILMDLANSDKSWNIIILRYFNPVGAHPSGLIGEDPKGIPNNLMPYMSQVAIGKLPVLYIFGTEFDTADGTGVRDYIHVVDLARGHVAAFDRLNKQQISSCEVYNLGTGKGYSVLEMVTAFEKVSGQQIKTENSLPRPGDVACVYCDPLLAAQKLGWKCQYGLEEMCLDLWNWQTKNPNVQRSKLAATKSLNVGILGHVDCGKTTLARALSTMGSTASFDKHAKASNLRANTIDLGYSTLTIDDTVIALIDCPGHASLIRSVLAASSVFDMAIVVIDSSKGIEQQTAEHLLLVSLLCPDHVILILNKIDLVNEKAVEQITKRCKKAASSLKINSNLQIVPISLMVHKDEAIVALIDALRLALYTPQRVSSGHFMMFVDHCFPMKGKGTIMTGTVVDGMCKVGMDVEIAVLQEKRKIKSMQRWKEDICSAGIGDRAALLFHNVPSNDINRTVIYEPGTLRRVRFLLVSVNRIEHFQGVLRKGSKLHVSTGFDTIIGQCQFLTSAFSEEEDHYGVVQELDETVKFAIISLERFVYTKEGSFFITSRLDHQGKGCRFVFHGIFLKLLDNDKQICRFRQKKKIGKVERIENERSIICNSLFKKETNIDIYCNMNVYLSTGEVGRIESAFGKNGKVRISFLEDLPESTRTACKNGSEIQVTLYFKKFLNDGKIKCCSPDLTTQMDFMSRVSLRFTPIRRIAILWNFSLYKNNHTLSSTSNGQSHKLLNISIRTKTTNKRRSYVEIIGETTENPINDNDTRFSGKGYVEIWKKPRKREQMYTAKTLSDMREDVDKLAQTLYKLRTNEKGQQQKPSEITVSELKVEEEDLRLSTYIDRSVERLSFTVRTPDRRILIKKFTGITISRTILEMLRDRKVRINEIVMYDFAIVCKPMDTLDIWKGELEENPAFARIDRFQILHILPSSCYQYFTVHSIAFRDFLVENWFPWEIPKVSNHH